MPFCPKCRYEYVAGVQDCPDCYVPLVESLDAEDTQTQAQAPVLQPSHKFVTLTRFDDSTEAEMAKMKLEREGVEARIAGGSTSAFSGAIAGSIALLVREGNEDKANQILEGEYQEEEADEKPLFDASSPTGTVPVIGKLTSSPVIKRHPNNPILKPEDVPYGPSLTFNPGVIKYQGKYIMAFRNDYFADDNKTLLRTDLGLATSNDGIKWDIKPEPFFNLRDEETYRAYDPRLTVIDDQVYMCFALDTRHGLRGGIATTQDFESWEILHLTAPDNRNMVLFPGMIEEMYFRLERPLATYGRGGIDRFDIWGTYSPDLENWGTPYLVMGAEHVPFANNKIGPAAPPIKTHHGWLTLFHAVDTDTTRGKNGWEESWQKRYTCGIMLLDINNPHRVIGISREPLIVPEESYEISGGFRDNVIFPGGMILEDNGEVKIYYGAGDATICLATARLDDLLGLLQPPHFVIPE